VLITWEDVDWSDPTINSASASCAKASFRRGAPPNAEYTFKHALVQDAAYSTLLRSRRQQIHGRIASALEGQFREIVEALPELLARHCAEAGLAETAVGYWLKAGKQAIARGAVTEGVAQLRKGIDLLSGQPDSEWRQEQELKLQIAIGQGLMAAKGYGALEAGEPFARARQLCEQLNWPPLLGQVLRGQFVFRLIRGELEQADRHAEEMRLLGNVRNDLIWRCFGFALSGAACFFRGNFIDASAHYRNALQPWDPRYRSFWGSPEDPYLVMLTWFGITLLCLGHVDEARSRLEEALTEARRCSPYDLTYVLSNARIAEWAMWGMNSAEAMCRSAEEALAISSEATPQTDEMYRSAGTGIE
jgi:tetratricopeptide (TPR) repeat protein